MAACVHMIRRPSWSSRFGVTLDANLLKRWKRRRASSENQMLASYLLTADNTEASSLVLLCFFRRVIKGEKVRLSKTHLKSYWLRRAESPAFVH